MLRLWTTMLCAIVLGIFGLSALAASAEEELQRANFSGDPNRPRHHFRIPHPARLTPVEAEGIYRHLADRLAAGYALGGHAVARGYHSWRRYNSAPYLSAAHGNLYVNNYANEAARAYGRFESAGKLPVGAVVAKDSFVVERDGTVRPGPLFSMEKMPPGFNYVSGDWRYIEIMPDGTFVGQTHGDGAERVEFCIACHLAKESQDHLFLVPPPYRVAP